MTSEVLDDYEEGTWTPTMEGLTTAGTPTYIYQKGDYVKVGSKVSLFFNLNVSTLGGAVGPMLVKGLPFTAIGLGESIGSMQANDGIVYAADVSHYSPRLSNGSAQIEFRGTKTTGANYDSMAVATVSYMRVQINYLTY